MSKDEIIKAIALYLSLLFCIFGSMLCIVKTLKSEWLEESASNNQIIEEIHIIEVPVIIDDNEPYKMTREEIWNSYMEKLTDDNEEEWWYGYKILISDSSVQPLHITDVYSEEELLYLYRCVETETYQCDFSSKAHVASVVINRLESEKFGDTFSEVITSPNQFAYSRTVISQSTIEACAFAFEIKDGTNGALFFHSGNYSDTFNGASYIFTDSCGHHFYK